MPLFPSEFDKRVLYLCIREDRLDTGNPHSQNHKFIMVLFSICSAQSNICPIDFAGQNRYIYGGGENILIYKGAFNVGS
jgi:hypothetical protein